MDRRHVVRLSGEADIEQIPIGFAGHPVGQFLNDVGLLRPLVLSVLNGDFDHDNFTDMVHERKETSPHWLANAAGHEPETYADHAVAIQLARRAISLAPELPSLHDALARRLSAAGRYDEAIEAHERAIALEPVVDYHWGLSKTLHKAGRLAEALAVAREIQALSPATAGYYAWSARLREEMGDTIGALADLRTASRNDPGNWHYKLGVVLLLARRARARLNRAFSIR
jgi:tetratricopeptide (TPR) repeat protein